VYVRLCVYVKKRLSGSEPIVRGLNTRGLNTIGSLPVTHIHTGESVYMRLCVYVKKRLSGSEPIVFRPLIYMRLFVHVFI